MNAYVYLGGAIILEVIGTTMMKSSDGFTKLWPSIGCVVAYAISFYVLSQTLRTLPTSIAYAIWSGVGIVCISVVAWLLHDQRLDFPAVIGIGLIVGGVTVINVFSKYAGH